MKNLNLSNHRTDKIKTKLSLITLSLLPVFAQAADPAYFSVNSTVAANQQNDGAKSSNAVAVGPAALAQGNNALALGSSVTANSAESATAVGNLAKATGDGSLAVGYKATATQASDIAVGREVRANGQGGAVVYGIQSVATGIAAVAVGSGAKVEGIYGSAANYAMALGFDAQSSQSGALSMGWSSRANGQSSIAIGHSATAFLKGTMAFGENAKAQKINDIVIGNGANTPVAAASTIGSSVVIGTNAFASGSYNNVIGHEARSRGSYNSVFGANAEAIGATVNWNPTYASAFGYKAAARDHRTLAAGAESYASGDASIALGHLSNASSTNTIAIGKSSVASKPYTVAISTNATASDWSAIAIGSNSVSSGASGVALGNTAKSTGHAIAIGANANASVLAGIAIGFDSIVGSGANGIAMGRNAKSENGGIAQGYYANATGRASIALGQSAVTTGEKATSIGIAAAASGLSSIALGEGAKANKATDISIGTATLAEGGYSVGLGSAVNATGLASIAIGNRTVASGDNAIAMGNQTKASGVRAVSIGHGANATTADDVALGSSSIASGAQLTDEAKFFNFNDDTRAQRKNFAAFNSRMTGAVSVGLTGFERQIHNVAPGRLSETSTDAVNGSQLYAVATRSGFNIQQNGTSKSRINNNGLVNFTDGTLTTVNVTDGDNSSTIKFDVTQGSLTTDANANTTATKAGVATAAEVANSLNAVRNTPLTFTGDSGASAVKKLGESVVITGDKNITTEGNANGIQVTLNKNIVVDSANIGGVTINNSGIDMNNQKITNLADATQDSDAVSYRQLKAFSVPYFSVNSTVAGNRQNDGAKSPNSVAIGPAALGQGESAIAIGHSAEAQGNYASAFGYKASARNHRTFAAGAESHASGDGAVALGFQANSVGREAISIGQATVSNEYSLAISANATALGYSSIAIGISSSAKGHSGMAIGNGAISESSSSIAMGVHSKATDLGSIAIGNGSVSNEARGIAIGDSASAKGYSIAQGMQATAEHNGVVSGSFSKANTESVAIGTWTEATGRTSLALGYLAKSKNSQDIAVGYNANASGGYAIALGTAANTSGLVGIAMGYSATASAENAISIGGMTKAEGIRSVTLGRDANAKKDYDVALGSSSIANGAQLTDEAKFFTFNDDTRAQRKNFAAYNSNMSGAVSLGYGGYERQIHNVAPGRLSETSTDAVNGSQLYAVATRSGFNIQQNGTSKSRINNNGLVNFTDGALTTVNVTDGDNSSTVKFDVTQGTLTTDANANTTATKAGVATTAEVATSLNTVRNTPLTFTGNSGTSAVKKLGESIAITGANGLTTVASANGIEVRIDDETRKKIDQVVNTEKTEVAAGKNITVTPNTSAGKTVYTIDATDTSASVSATNALTVTPNGTKAVGDAQVTDYQIDLSQKTKDDIQKGVDAHNKVTNEGLTFSGDDNAQSAVKKLGDSVAITGDTNIETKGTTDGVKVTLKKDVTLDSVTTGKTVMNDSGVKVGDVTLTDNGLTAGNVSVTKTGINAGNHKITNVEDGEVSESSKDAVNGSQLYQVKNEINTNITKAKTEVQAGKNTEVIADTGANGQTVYTINATDTSASVSTTDALTVKNNGTTSVGDAQVTDYQIDLSQKTKDEIKKGIDAHETVTNKGLTFAGDSGTSAVKKLGDSVAITGDNNIKTEGDNDGVKVTLNKDVVVDSVTTGNTVMNNSGVKVGDNVSLTNNGLTAGNVSVNTAGINAGNHKIVNVEDGEVSENSKDAVNGSQLHKVKLDVAKAKTEVVAGKNVVVDGSQKGTDGHQIYKVTARDSSAKITANSTALSVVPKGTETIQDGNNVTEVTEYAVDLSDDTKKDINDAKKNAKDALDTAQKGWDITAVAGEGKTVISVGKENVAPGQTVTIEAGKNIVVTHKKDRVMNIAVDANPTFDSVVSKGDVTVNGTIHANGGLTVAPNQNIDMGGNRITNVAKGVNPTDAVNKSQLDSAINNVNYNINRLDNKIDKVDKKLRAGIAGATAISFLQQPQGAGKSRVSMGVGGYRNEQAIAVGYGRNSDNNKVSFKVGGSVNSRGDLNWGSSVGYEW